MASIVRSVTNADNVPTVVWLPVSASQTISLGDLVQIDATSRKLVAAVAGSTTIAGISQQDITTGATVTDDDIIPVVLVRNQVVKMDFDTSGSKKTIADTDKFTTAFDLKDKGSIDPNAASGMCFVQDYNNDDATVDVIFDITKLANVG